MAALTALVGDWLGCGFIGDYGFEVRQGGPPQESILFTILNQISRTIGEKLRSLIGCRSRRRGLSAGSVTVGTS